MKQLIVAGGVAANQGLRGALREAMTEALPEVTLLIPPLKLCGDNAAMVASFAFTAMKKGDFADLSLNAKPSLAFEKEE